MREYILQIYHFKHRLNGWQPVMIGKSNRRRKFWNCAKAHRALEHLREKETRPTRVWLATKADQENKKIRKLLKGT